ncbi:MAG TPA: hypothetical protein VIW64_03395 [Pyrinomonadaceae bacterium]|jgi:hypothetical protein
MKNPVALARESFLTAISYSGMLFAVIFLGAVTSASAQRSDGLNRAGAERSVDRSLGRQKERNEQGQAARDRQKSEPSGGGMKQSPAQRQKDEDFGRNKPKN